MNEQISFLNTEENACVRLPPDSLQQDSIREGFISVLQGLAAEDRVGKKTLTLSSAG